MDRLRLGFVGAGAISLRLMPHFQVADTAARVELAAACDPVVQRAEAAMAKFGGPGAQAYSSLTEMLADDTVDAVSIGSPIGLHHAHALEAIRAGKHVHVNKTMTTTVAEADEIIAAAADNEVTVVASPGEMLRPHNQRIKQLLADGGIGTVTWATCGAAFGDYHQDEPERQGSDPMSNVDPTWYFRNPGGGPLYDLTVYPLHAITGILGPAQRVTALSGTRIPQRTVHGRQIHVECHDNTLILLDFGGGLFALAYGTAAGNLTPNVEFDFSCDFYGTDGTIRGLLLNGEPFDYPGRELARSGPDQGMHSNFGGNEWVLPHISAEHRELQELHVFEDLMQLVDWATTGTPSVATAQHARHVIDIIESAYTAAATGTTQTLRTTF